MSDRHPAEQRMTQAKAAFTAAARAALRGDPDAVDLAKTAFENVARARAELAALADNKEVEHGGR